MTTFKNESKLPYFYTSFDESFGLRLVKCIDQGAEILVQVLVLNLNTGSMRARIFDAVSHELLYANCDLPIDPFLKHCKITSK